MKIDPAVLQQCWFLTGPTACGKSSVGLVLAERLNAEVIALDSMSLYRGMNIGTAKPSAADRRRVPHHLLDVLDPDKESTVADYLKWADQACRDVLDRNRVPLFVGGTGLYLRALLRGVFKGPSADPSFRRQLEIEARDRDRLWLHERLMAVDPTTAARLHPHDQRRLIRALEIHYLTGRPASQQQSEAPLPPNERPQHVFWLSPPRAWLHDRIDQRVIAMINAGWVDEVRELLSSGRPLSRTARQALGYQELIEHVTGGLPLDEAVRRIQTRTRQFAKRQHTWFRNLEECREVPITGAESALEIATRLATIAG